MRKGQVFRTEDGEQLRIEEIQEVFYPFGDKTLQPKAQLIVTIGREKK